SLFGSAWVVHVSGWPGRRTRRGGAATRGLGVAPAEGAGRPLEPPRVGRDERGDPPGGGGPTAFRGDPGSGLLGVARTRDASGSRSDERLGCLTGRRIGKATCAFGTRTRPASGPPGWGRPDSLSG